MNPYLKAKRAAYEKLRGQIEDIQNRATTEKRDLKDDELRSIEQLGEQAQNAYTEIETLTKIELRHQAVGKLAADVTGSDGDGDGQDDDGQGNDDGQGDGQGDQRNRSGEGPDGGGDQRNRGGDGGHQRLTGNARTRDRDPGHYTRSGKRSFFGDLMRSRDGDSEAATRLVQHNRALATTPAGAGIVPPKWLTEEFEVIARQGRRLAAAVRQIDLGDDPRPITMPKQTSGATVVQQSAENASVQSADAWASNVVTVTPMATAGMQIVSRQMLDMGSPAVDQLIYADLWGDYNDKVEQRVAAAMLASAGPAVATHATNAAFASDLGDSLVDAALAVLDSRKLPADIAVMNIPRWGRYKKLKDTTNRPLVPSGNGGPMNVIGVGDVAVDGQLHDLGLIATNGIPATYPEPILVARASDTILFESPVMRFRYEEPLGPESIKLGIWGYTAVHVKYAGQSVKRITVTAA